MSWSWREAHHIDRRRWRQLRCPVRQRAAWRCERCGRAGRLEVDHKTPLRDGGALYDLDNLQALCRGCHIEKTRGENAARRNTPAPVLAWRELVEATQ